METLTIIIGSSIFSGAKAVGIALGTQTDSRGMTRWADQHGKGGRPCTVETLNDYKSEEMVVARMRARWEDWAARSGVNIHIAPKVRCVKNAF